MLIMKNLPSVTRQTAIAKRQDVYLSNKQTMLMLPEVQMNVSSSDLEIASASVENPVRKYQDSELVKNTVILAKYICKDYGIVNFEGKDATYAATRFMKTLQKYYSDFSLKEVRIAFELAAVGELDEWLPKDKHGKPDAKHYNSFNVEYYTKILNAYRSKRSKVWTSVKKALPKPETIITQAQRDENRKVFLNDIYTAFENYQEDHEQKPNFVLSIFIEEFVNVGLIKEVQKPTKLTIEKCYKKMLHQTKGNDRKSMIDKFYRSEYDGVLLSESQLMQNNIDIRRAFDIVIEQKKHIKDFIN